MQAVGVVDCTGGIAEGNANPGVTAVGVGQGGDDDPSQQTPAAPAAAAAAAASTMADSAQGNNSDETGTRSKRKYVQWTSNMEYALSAQVDFIYYT